jgi:hypothetical protein
MASPEFESSLQALEATLKEAQAEVLKDPRGAAITALRGVIGFIEAIPRFESQDLTLPLTALMAALHDLDTGRVGKIVRPKKAPELRNRQPDPSLRYVIKAYSIFAVNELRDHGSQIDDACKFVAFELRHAKVPISVGRSETPTWKTVRTWRNEVSRRRDNDKHPDLLLRTLKELKRECPFQPDMPLEQVKTQLAQKLRVTLPILQAALD